MNSDIVLFESNQIRASLEKQTLHNAELIKQIQALELKLSLATASPPTRPSSKTSNSVIFDLDIESLCMAYQSDSDIKAFEEKKSAELKAIREKIAKYANAPNVHVILFAERYISRFRTFCERQNSEGDAISLIVRLPLFLRSEVQNFIKHIPTGFKKSIYVPYIASDVEKKAQRVFIYQKAPLPPAELKGADMADSPNINWGFDQVVFYRINQGD
ncbi:hypothetical protein IPC24_16120 [Pseudomonas aeruginosa]|nr:hypothetical protein IPC775_16130 [Pseudomonas aeruginosa]RQI41414.1 hypothetical protein IPC24_16120 [Pseudomonas aeruginosa]